MSNRDEHRTWTEPDADRVIEDLRGQLEGAKARVAEMKQGIAATGRKPKESDGEANA